MRKLLCYIIVFLLPLNLTMMFVRKANNVEEYGSFKILYEYLEQYPVESVEDIKYLFTNWNDILFQYSEFDPDWTGDIWSDIQEIGQLLADGFMFVISFISWQIAFIWDVLRFVWDSFSWIINLPFYVLQN